MTFNLETWKTKYNISGYKFSEKDKGEFRDLIGKKKSILGDKIVVCRECKAEPTPRDMASFINNVKKLNDGWNVEEAILLVPTYDKTSFKQILDKSAGIIGFGLKQLIKVQETQATEEPKPSDTKNELDELLEGMDESSLRRLGVENGIALPPKWDEKQIITRLRESKRINVRRINKFLTKYSKELEERKLEKAVHKVISKPEVIKKIESGRKENTLFDTVYQLLKKMPIEKRSIRDEHDLETICYTYLSSNLKNVQMEKHYDKGRLDFRVGKNIAVELKFVKKGKVLQDAFGQIAKYADEYKYIVLYFINAGNVPNSEINLWKKKIENINEAKVKVIEST